MFEVSSRNGNQLLMALGLLCLLTVSERVSCAPTSAEVSDICKLVPPNTKILQPGTCTNWVECGLDGEVLDAGTCLEGWYFDRNTGKCGKKSSVECGFADVTPIKSPCAKVITGTFLAHPEQCNGFIYCKDGVELYSQCPDGLNFEPSTQRCVYTSEYSCPEKEDAGSVNELCLSIGDNVHFSDPNSCISYRFCSKGLVKERKCVPGTYFSRVNGGCGNLDESDCARNSSLPSNISCGTDEAPIVGFISDEATCGGYYYCDEMEDGRADRNPKFGRCADGKFFDANLFSCKDRENVRCVYDRCEGMGNRFANKQGDCAKYYYCNNGVSTTEGSCPDGYYFDEKMQSCTNQYVAYMSCVN